MHLVRESIQRSYNKWRNQSFFDLFQHFGAAFKSSVPRAFRYHALLTILLPLRRFFGEVDGSDIALWTLYPSRRLLSARVSLLGTRLAPSKARARSEENSIFCARSISTTARTSASPKGRPGQDVLFEAGLAMDRRPAKMVLVRPVGHISRLPPPRRTSCVRRCPGLCHGRRTSLGMWRGQCKHAVRRVHRP